MLNVLNFLPFSSRSSIKSILHVRLGRVGCNRVFFSGFGILRFIFLLCGIPRLMYTRRTLLWFQQSPSPLIRLKYSGKPLAGSFSPYHLSFASTSESSFTDS